MSKSLGNVIKPEDILKKSGADILRLWIANTDFRSEMVASDEIFKRVSDQYRRIRNTLRFLVANLNDFDVHLEPSAGSGSFFNIMDENKKIGLDIEPKEKNIINSK